MIQKSLKGNFEEVKDKQGYKPQFRKYIFNGFFEVKEFFKNVVKSQLELDEAWAEDTVEYFLFNYYQDVLEFKNLDNLFTSKLIKI